MRKALIVTGLLVPLLLGGVVAGLLYTETGLRWSFRVAQSLVPGELTVQRLTGRLAGPLTIAGLRYQDETTTVTGGNLAFDWMPARLLAGRVRIKRLEATDLDIAITRPSAAKPDNAAEFTLPLPITMADASIHRLILRLPGREPLVITRLEASVAAEATHVALDRLHIESPRGTMNADGRIPLHSDGVLQLDTDWHIDYEGHPLGGRGTISGTLQHMRADQRLSQPIGLHVFARMDTDARPPRWRVDADADPFSLSRLIPASRPVHFSRGTLHAEGQGATFRADGGFDVEDDEYGAWSMRFNGSWDGSQWRIPSFTVAAIDGRARITGSATQLSSGDDGRDDYRLDVDWTNLAWPPRGEPLVASSDGGATLSGRPDDYRVHTHADLRYGTLPGSTLKLDGHGDRSRLTLDEVRMNWLDGTWNGHGSLSWSDTLDWALTLDARDLDPANLRAGLDGKLNGTIALEGHGTGPDFHVTGEVTRLTGTLRTGPVTGGARFAAGTDGFTVSDLELRSGAAELRGAAHLGKRWEINWSLQAPDLSSFHPDLNGRLSTHGEVSGTPEALRIDAVLEADTLTYRRSGTDALTAEAHVDLGRQGKWHIDMASEQTVIEGRNLGHVSLKTDGSTRSHTIQLLVSDASHRYEHTVDGSFTGQQWQGRLRNGSIEHPAVGQWSQSGTASLSVSRTGARLEEICWRSQDARACAAGTWEGDGNGNASLTWDNINPALVEPWLEGRQIRLTGRSHGALRVKIADAGLDNGTLAMTVDNGTISYPLPSSDEPHRLAFEEATLTAVAGAPDGLRADGKVILNRTERISAHLVLQGWNPRAPVPSAGQPVAGRISLQLDDLSVLTLLVPDVLPRGARLHTNLDVSGTVGAPRFSGSVELELAALAVARLGIVLEDLSLQGRVQSNRWQVQGAARSGQGRMDLTGQGRVEGLRQWEGRFDVEGERFQALHLPTAMVVVSPDLHFDIRPGDIAFDGELRIPAANIAPQWSGETMAASEDVIIKGGDVPSAPSRTGQIHGTIKLVLGDGITIEGKGFEGRLDGELRLTVHRDGDVIAEGELRIVHGRYEAYGQKLEISEGRLLYAGGSIDNPALDITAKRRRVDVEVGIRVTGTAKQPVLELFSDPAMDDGDILSYLILGRPMNQAGGDDGRLLYRAATSVALIGGEALAERIATEFSLEEVTIETGEEESDTALVLGKHLSPRLYLRYIQGLVDNASAFQIRYQLSDKWSLETESGTSGAGADLLFTLEK